jgi:8-oxo-dGTP diphosphatase
MTDAGGQNSQSPKSAPLLVTAAVIFRGGEFLISQRRQSDRVEPGRWEFPGGKVEFSEDPKSCLVREIREELNLEIAVGELLDVSSHVYELSDRRLHVVLLCYLCTLVGGELKNLAVDDARWITIDEIDGFTFAAADIQLVNALKHRIRDFPTHL